MVSVNEEIKNSGKYIWLEIYHIKSIFAPKDIAPVNVEEGKDTAIYSLLYILQVREPVGTNQWRSLKLYLDRNLSQ